MSRVAKKEGKKVHKKLFDKDKQAQKEKRKKRKKDRNKNKNIGNIVQNMYSITVPITSFNYDRE